MPFSYTVADRISFGNMKLIVLNLTDVQNDGTSQVKFGQTVYGVKALNNTDSSDTFKEAVGAKSATTTKNQVTFTSVTNDDDGIAGIWYR